MDTSVRSEGMLAYGTRSNRVITVVAAAERICAIRLHYPF